MLTYSFKEILDASGTKDQELRSLRRRDQVALALGKADAYSGPPYLAVDGVALLLAGTLAQSYDRTFAAQLVRTYWPLWMDVVSHGETTRKPAQFCLVDFVRNGKTSTLACGAATATIDFDAIVGELSTKQMDGAEPERVTCVNVTRLCTFLRKNVAVHGIDMLDPFLPPPTDPDLRKLLDEGSREIDGLIVVMQQKNKSQEAVARRAGDTARAVFELKTGRSPAENAQELTVKA